MDNAFLEHYIHLEKLCNDIYGNNYGITSYIEDMESTSSKLQNQIPNWNEMYYKLKELRWKRNMYVHEGVTEYTEVDIDLLKEIYQQIIERKDVLALRQELIVNSSLNVETEDKEIASKKDSDKLIWFFLGLVVLPIVTILIFCFAI